MRFGFYVFDGNDHIVPGTKWFGFIRQRTLAYKSKARQWLKRFTGNRVRCTRLYGMKK